VGNGVDFLWTYQSLTTGPWSGRVWHERRAEIRANLPVRELSDHSSFVPCSLRLDGLVAKCVELSLGRFSSGKGKTTSYGGAAAGVESLAKNGREPLDYLPQTALEG
jgi:hypothetical protein